MKVAFLGLGNMGRPMAQNLVKAGHEVIGYDVVTSAAAASGLTTAGTIAAAVKDAEAVITMLPAGPQATQAYLDRDGVFEKAPRGALLIDCSTIDVAAARLIAAEAEQRGFAMLDAPVSGGVGGATAATLTFMVGGPGTALEAARPLLEAMGKTIVPCGGAGNGQAAKICNNMILGVSMAAVAEAFALAKRLGLDAQTLFDVSSTSSGQCWSLTSYCPVPGPLPTSPANRDYAPGFAAAMMLKDLELAQAAAAGAGARTPMGEAAARLYREHCGDEARRALDFSSVYLLLDQA